MMSTAFSGFCSCILTEVTVTDHLLGRGSYAIVLEVNYKGKKCAGKKIHDVLLAQGSSSSTYSMLKFEEECLLLSKLRHPNIVEFLGVFFEDRTQPPILVMEFLSTDLTSCIKRHGILPKEISYSILHDVAKGLNYLHNQHPPVIHRDLTSNNVLITSDMAAKISDLGVAKIVDLPPLQVSRMTQTPGTPSYMPPEVMISNPKYDASIDEFSYGILIIHVLSGKWPEPHTEPNRVEANKLIPVSEAERRKVFLDAIGRDHPLMDLVLRCLSNNRQLRPHSGEIVKFMKDVVKLFPCMVANEFVLFTETVPDSDTKQVSVKLEAETRDSSLHRRTKARKPVEACDKQLVEYDKTLDKKERGPEMSLSTSWSKAKKLFVQKTKTKLAAVDLPSPPTLISAQCSYPLCVALCAFNRSEAEELSFRRGDLLHIISDKHRWWFVRSKRTGEQGFIPSNYVIMLPQGEEIPQNKIQLMGKVGESKSSHVYKGIMYDVLHVTVKVSKPACARYSNEAALLLSLKHPNIVQLYGVCSTRVPMCTVLEYLKHGSLCDYLRDGDGRTLKLPQLVHMASQIAAGMAYLEQRNYNHRDLTSRNVLVGENLICKVANFDSARIVREEDYMVLMRMETFIKWIAPECLQHHLFTIKSDIWSFGVVLYETVTNGRPPYPGLSNAQVLEQVLKGYRMPRPMTCPEKLYDIMLKCWKKEPECRPTFETLQWQLEEFFVT